MPDHKRRYESMLFNYETTGRTDYRDGEIEPPIKTVYKPKPKRDVQHKHAHRFIHTLVYWEKPCPFDLFHKPKEVVKTNPNTVQKAYHPPVDMEREDVQKIRPRLVMTPSVSMDDITDRDVRSMLIADIYETTVQKANEEGVALSKYKSVKAPLPGLPAPANPIVLAKLTPPVVSPEWRMDSVTWDNRQLRTFCDPTKEFWLAHHSKCSACEATAARDAQKKMGQMKRRS